MRRISYCIFVHRWLKVLMLTYANIRFLLYNCTIFSLYCEISSENVYVESLFFMFEDLDKIKTIYLLTRCEHNSLFYEE